MALIKCPECNNQISDQADSCPKCGYELKKKEKEPENKEENKLKPDTNLIKITNCFRKNQESELARKILPFPDSHATLKDEKFKLFQSF